jgi:hypothetical protein
MGAGVGPVVAGGDVGVGAEDVVDDVEGEPLEVVVVNDGADVGELDEVGREEVDDGPVDGGGDVAGSDDVDTLVCGGLVVEVLAHVVVLASVVVVVRGQGPSGSP